MKQVVIKLWVEESIFESLYNHKSQRRRKKEKNDTTLGEPLNFRGEKVLSILRPWVYLCGQKR